jgi:hypothetical protein
MSISSVASSSYASYSSFSFTATYVSMQSQSVQAQAAPTSAPAANDATSGSPVATTAPAAVTPPAHHHHRGGGLAQAVMSALKELGFGTSSDAASASATGSSSGTATGSTASSGTPATGTAATKDNDGDDDDGVKGASKSDKKSTSSDVEKALHQFLHDLFKAAKSQDSGNSQAGHSDGEHEHEHHHHDHGYGSLASGLQGLIDKLSNTGSGASTPAVADATSTTTAPAATAPATSSDATSPTTTPKKDVLSKLTTDFQNLLKAMGGGASSSTAKAPTLVDFLKQLETKLRGQPQAPVGSLVSTTA